LGSPQEEIRQKEMKKKLKDWVSKGGKNRWKKQKGQSR